MQNEFSSFNMLNTFYSRKEFKYYKNIIIHYTGIDKELFYTKLATILSYLVIDYFEPNIIKNILNANYFYFENAELNKILELCEENLCEDDEFSFQNRQLALFDIFYEYISSNNTIILTGFINFRLADYRKILEELVDFSVNEFIIKREYLEFISLLRLYVNSQPSSNIKVHAISFNDEIILLDENMNQIPIDKKNLNAKYLSDVSFSNNDYILNTLLNLLPQKIHLHIVQPSCNLDFINTLQLVFEKRIKICHNCNICNLYKKLSIKNN